MVEGNGLSRAKAEGSPNGMALVSKTSGSNPLQVQVLYPPLSHGIEKTSNLFNKKFKGDVEKNSASSNSKSNRNCIFGSFFRR